MMHVEKGEGLDELYISLDMGFHDTYRISCLANDQRGFVTYKTCTDSGPVTSPSCALD